MSSQIWLCAHDSRSESQQLERRQRCVKWPKLLSRLNENGARLLASPMGAPCCIARLQERTSAETKAGTQAMLMVSTKTPIEKPQPNVGKDT
mmetsp:Transcript_27722/g.68913  ORF Transcript_27722/g.68913 Transcript_27722/m.68913 type:complete len:92 (-) Transcript_27722:385-660(-)